MSLYVPFNDFEAEFAERMSLRHTNLPYHNFDGHVLSALDYFTAIVEDLATKNVDINVPLGRLAILAHDAGYHEDHLEQGFETKEAYSADIAADELLDMGLEKPKIEIVSSAILATHFTAVPETNLEKAVRLADIGNVSADEVEFLRNMALLIQEAVVLKVPLKETFKEHCLSTQSFLSAYLEPAPTFTAHDGTIVFLDRHMSFVNNIARLSNLPLRTFISLSGVKLDVPQQWKRP